VDIRFPDHAHCGALTHLLREAYPGVPSRVARHLAKGETLYQQGEPTDELFMIESGRIRTLTLSPAGRELVTGEFGPGEAVGEVCFCEVRARQETAVALEDATVVPLGPADLIAFAKSSDGALIELLGMFVHRLAQAESRLAEARTSVRERLVAYLLRNASHTDESGLAAMDRPVSHEEIARHVGTTREQVSLLLEGLRRDGAILYDRRSPIRVDRNKLGAPPQGAR